MKITYDVTEEIYEEAICYQMKLHNSQRWQVIRYWGLNIGFFAVAIFFFVTRTGYPLWRRLYPLGMAVILLGLSTWRRVDLPKRAKSALKRYVRQGVLEEGFLGRHTLIVENGKIRRQAGKSWKEIPASSFAGLMDLDKAVLMIAAGVIFDTIPKDALEKDGIRERLLEEIMSSVHGPLYRKATQAMPEDVSGGDISAQETDGSGEDPS